MPVYSSRPKPLVIEFLEAATGQYQEDFLLEDRSKLQDVAFTMRRHLYAGFALGVILGLGSAQVVRGNNKAFLKALRIHGIPSHVVFSNGRLEAVPNIATRLRFNTMTDRFSYVLYGFCGGYVGLIVGEKTGSSSASKTLAQDPESKERIGRAFREYKATVLQKEKEEWDEGKRFIKDLF